VMVKPPLDFRRSRVFEIDNCIHVADEIGLIEQCSGTMNQPMKFKFRRGINPLMVQAAEK